MEKATVIDVQAVGAQRIQAVALKFHLKMLAAGMRNSRFTGSQILAKAGSITGRTYKRGQYSLAQVEVEAWLEANQ